MTVATSLSVIIAVFVHHAGCRFEFITSSSCSSSIQNRNDNKYIFLAGNANFEDVIFDGEWFAVGETKYYRSNKQYRSLTRLVRFLNENGRPTSLYFCSKHCVRNYNKEGHYHVVFEAKDLADAQAVLSDFLPNYKCEKIYSPKGMDTFLNRLDFIGRTYKDTPGIYNCR